MWDGDWFFFCVVVAPVLAVVLELLSQVWRYYVPAERPRLGHNTERQEGA